MLSRPQNNPTSHLLLGRDLGRHNESLWAYLSIAPIALGMSIAYVDVHAAPTNLPSDVGNLPLAAALSSLTLQRCVGFSMRAIYRMPSQ
jgi:hypothetical protein